MSDLIVQALLSKGPSNISQITHWIASVKGQCARETVRKRLPGLRAIGVLAQDDSGLHCVSDSFVSNWTTFLGRRDSIGRGAESIRRRLE